MKRLSGRIAHLMTAARNLGIPSTVRYCRQWFRNKRGGDDRLLTLTSKFARHPLAARAGTTDLEVFKQIFVELEYACLDGVRDGGLILDCGANVGYSSAYLLSRFPRARLVAVEPDADNFALLARNLAPYGESARLLHAALWSHPARLTLAQTAYRGGGEWARQVRECRPDEEASTPAVDVGTLLRESGFDTISILKMDIEGAEGVVFSANFRPWISRVENLVIELHDDTAFGDCSTVFAEAIEGQGFAVTRSGERTVCRRPAPAPVLR